MAKSILKMERLRLPTEPNLAKHLRGFRAKSVWISAARRRR